jgi:translation elongation factor EF-G
MITALTHKREAFARLYVEHGDASKAYREAFPSSQKWKDESVWQKSSTLLKDVKVQSRVEELKSKRSQKLDISENRVIAEIAAIAFQDIGEVEGEHGGFAGLKALKPATRRAIQSVKFKRYLERKKEGGFEEVEVTEIKMHPKLPALDKICEIKGITKPPIQAGQVNVNINLKGKSDVRVDHR